MNWSTPESLSQQVQKLWDRGQLLSPLAGGEDPFPKRLVCRMPTAREQSEQFDAVRTWISRLKEAEGHYRIAWRSINHRVLGQNAIPEAVWVDTLDDALAMIGKRRQAVQFSRMVSSTRGRVSELVPWLRGYPQKALKLADVWDHLLDVVVWMRGHPRPGIYFRQVDISGVHSKFIESNRSVLSELFDLVLPEDAIDVAATGIAGFASRYGFTQKPLRVRFRLLDPFATLYGHDADQDITLTSQAFSLLDPPVSRVFITENEINFLAFPPTRDAMAVFGAGYGFEHLAGAGWLCHRILHYWGDIDTHGFAILDRLRMHFPEVVSFLMDEATLLSHRPYWGSEGQQERGELRRLSREEDDLYGRLRDNHWGERVRLEQERIGFEYLVAALERIVR